MCCHSCLRKGTNGQVNNRLWGRDWGREISGGIKALKTIPMYNRNLECHIYAHLSGTRLLLKRPEKTLGFHLWLTFRLCTRRESYMKAI